MAASIAVISHVYMFFSNLIITMCYHLNITYRSWYWDITYGIFILFQLYIHMSSKHYLNLQYLSIFTPCAGCALPWFCVYKFNITIKVLHKIIYHLYVKDIFWFSLIYNLRRYDIKCQFYSKSPRYFGSSLVYIFFHQ